MIKLSTNGKKKKKRVKNNQSQRDIKINKHDDQELSLCPHHTCYTLFFLHAKLFLVWGFKQDLDSKSRLLSMPIDITFIYILSNFPYFHDICCLKNDRGVSHIIWDTEFH